MENEDGAASEPLPDAPLDAVLESLLFACEEPVTLDDLAAILGEGRREEIGSALEGLRSAYGTAARGLRVQRIAGGYRLTTSPDLAPYVREMVRTRNRKRLSRAALETLAIVAYKQPITGPEIQDIRGVNPSSILNTLLERHLVRILGRKRVVGKPFLYGTTREFLIRFGLNSLDDLPSMEEFDALLVSAIEVDDDPQEELPAAGEADETAADAAPVEKP